MITIPAPSSAPDKKEINRYDNSNSGRANPKTTQAIPINSFFIIK
ncbi:hypothetical protein C7377_1668 [Balneicella halophila]|uniref:Uncharacterized protein n=1 Tax=Balneicella halophila TaxID=1537566 RepID=A0A7L4UNA3_BALHA|nr:hypothetical protein C7377_1668 [Balneicella halophila]